MIDKNKISKRKKLIGPVSNSHAQIINSLLDSIDSKFTIDEYELWIDGTAAEHIEARHGKKGRADFSMATRDAKMLIPWAAQNAEFGDFIYQNGTPKLSERYFNNDGSKGVEIKLEKTIDAGVVYVSECVTDGKNKRVYITSSYISEKSSNGQLLNMDSTESPQPTPEASFDSNATNNNIPDNSKNVNSNERNSKKSENRGVNWNDLTEGTDIGKQAEDNSDIRVHPPAPNKKTTKEESSKAEPEKETKKPKRPLKVTKALTDDEAHNILAYIMEDHFKGITEDTKMAYLPGAVRKDVQNRLTHIANTNDTESYVGKVYEIAELICNEAVIREQYDVSDRYDLDEARRTIDILDSYKGKINLEAIREDIKSVYDTRAPHLVRTWGAKKTRGVSTDVIREELAEYGIKIDSP